MNTELNNINHHNQINKNPQDFNNQINNQKDSDNSLKG